MLCCDVLCCAVLCCAVLCCVELCCVVSCRVVHTYLPVYISSRGRRRGVGGWILARLTVTFSSVPLSLPPTLSRLVRLAKCCYGVLAHGRDAHMQKKGTETWRSKGKTRFVCRRGTNILGSSILPRWPHWIGSWEPARATHTRNARKHTPHNTHT